MEASFLCTLQTRGRGSPDQVVEGAQGRVRAVPHGDDDLLGRRGGRIAGGEDAGRGGPASVIHLDLTVRRERDAALAQPLGVGHETDLHEDAVDGKRMLLAAPAIGERAGPRPALRPPGWPSSARSR